MVITRKEHRVTLDEESRPVVRFHVTDAEGRCVPDACVGRAGLCGYARKYQARQAMIRYRRDLEAIEHAGRSW